MATGQDGLFHDAGIGLDYVWLDGGAGANGADGAPGGAPRASLLGPDDLRAAVASALLRSAWPLRGAEIRWLRGGADMGLPAFARASGVPAAEVSAWEGNPGADLPAGSDHAIRPRVASLLGLEADGLPFPSPQPEGAERRLIARHEAASGAWSAELPGAEPDADRLVALAEASSDPLVRGLLALLRAEAEAGDRAREMLAADLSLLRVGPSSMGFTIETAGRAVAILAGQMATWLREHGAENYTETGFTHHEAPFTVTVQRRAGKTPHQLRLDAKRRANAMEAALRDAPASLGGEAAAAVEAALARALASLGEGAEAAARTRRYRGD